MDTEKKEILKMSRDGFLRRYFKHISTPLVFFLESPLHIMWFFWFIEVEINWSWNYFIIANLYFVPQNIS